MIVLKILAAIFIGAILIMGGLLVATIVLAFMEAWDYNNGEDGQ